MYTIVCFSPSGNARHLAGKLAGELGIPEEDILPLEFTDPQSLAKNDHLVLLYPVHGFNAPRTVKKFVGQIPEGLFNSVSLISVGCAEHWVNAAVSGDLRRKLVKKAYPLMVDEVLAMPLTFVMNFPETLNRELIPAAEQKIKTLGRQIARKEKSLRKVPFKARIINFLGKAESPAARLFGLELHANGKCTTCGTCWSNCPQQNIREKSKGKPGFGFNCIMCMRCIYSCPEKAISPRFSKFIPVKGGYSLSSYLE